MWLTYRSDRLPDFHTWWLKWQMTQTHKRVCYLAFVVIAAHLGEQIAPKSLFWGHEWAFSSQTHQMLKRSYYQNYCIDQNHVLQSVKNPKYSL